MNEEICKEVWTAVSLWDCDQAWILYLSPWQRPSPMPDKPSSHVIIHSQELEHQWLDFFPFWGMADNVAAERPECYIDKTLN